MRFLKKPVLTRKSTSDEEPVLKRKVTYGGGMLPKIPNSAGSKPPASSSKVSLSAKNSSSNKAGGKFDDFTI
jgi:hypothetical protein